MAIPEWMKPKGLTNAVNNSVNNIKNDMSKAYQNYQVNTVANKVQPKVSSATVTKPNQFDSIYGEISNIRNQLTQPTQQFSYDINSDPQYQAALRQAQVNSQQAAGNIAADMNKRGLLNSTITQDRGNQAAQREYGHVSDTLVPQMMQQAYQRYTTDQANRRQGLLDQVDLLGTQYDFLSGERDYTDTQNAAAAKARADEKQSNWNAYMDMVDRRGDFGTGPKSDWGLLANESFGTPTLDTQRQMLDEQKFYEDIRQFGVDVALKQAGMEQDARQFSQRMGLDWAQLSQRDKEFIANETWKQKNYDLDVQREDRLSRENNAAPSKADAKDSAEYKGQASDYISNMTRSEAKEYLSQVRDYFTDADYRALLQEAGDLSD